MGQPNILPIILWESFVCSHISILSSLFQISKRDVSVVPFLTGLISYKWIMKVIVMKLSGNFWESR